MPIGKPLEQVIADKGYTLDVDAVDSHTWTFDSVTSIDLDPSTATLQACVVEQPNKAFTLNESTGQILSGNVVANYECELAYQVLFSVTDSGKV